MSLFDAFALAHEYLVDASRSSTIISLAEAVHDRQAQLKQLQVDEVSFAEAVLFCAAGAGLGIQLDYPLPKNLFARGDILQAMSVMRAQALAYTRDAESADQLLDTVLRMALADVREAFHYRSEVDWLLDIMRRVRNDSHAVH